MDIQARNVVDKDSSDNPGINFHANVNSAHNFVESPPFAIVSKRNAGKLVQLERMKGLHRDF